jgi:hypothetical protein
LEKEEIVDHTIWKEENLGHYKISIIAKLNDHMNFHNVAYMIRLEDQNDRPIDFMLSLKGFKELGDLCIALSKFCEKRIAAADKKDIEKLKKLLTYDNIMNFAAISDFRDC